MASSFALIALFSLAMFAGITEARKDPGADWQAVAKTEALVEAIDHLVHTDSSLSDKKKTTSGCHTSNKDSATTTVNKRTFVTDFEPRPNLSAYGDDTKQKEDKTFMKDFEPRPNLSAYGDDAKQKEDKTFMKDFEPRPNLSAYGDDAKQKERPNISVYDDDDVGLKGEKNFEKDSEPRPNISVYQD